MWLVGAPGPDFDVAVYLREENGKHVIWMAPYDWGDFRECVTHKVWAMPPEYAPEYPRTVAEAAAIREVTP